MQGLIGIDPTQVRTSAEGPAFVLGTRGFQMTSSGVKEFIYLRPTEAITGAGYGCVFTTGFRCEMLDLTATTPGVAGPGSQCGWAMAAVAQDGYGWFQVHGKATVRTLASAAKGTRLNTTGTSGVLDDDGTAGSEQIWGVVIMTATGGAEANNSDGYLSYPVVGVTL